jgi:hypothetical protein
MNRAQVRETIRTLLNDIENSDLAHNWPNAMVNSFIQEAIDEISQRTLCNKDSISEEYCVIYLDTDTIHYPFPYGVLSVSSARKSWDGRELKNTTFEIARNQTPLWETTTMEPTKYMTDFSTGYLSLVGRLATVTDQQLNLTVRRMPAQLVNDTEELDIPVRFHHYTYNWIMYRLLQKLGNEEDAAKRYGVEMSQRFLVAFEGNPSQLGYGGDIGKIMRMLNNFDTAPRCSTFF